MIKKIDEIQKLLLLGLPILLITGSFLPDLAISLVAILFLGKNIYDKNWKYIINIPSIFFLLWCVYLIIGSLFSDNYYLSLQSSLFYWRFGIYALAIWYILDTQPSFKKNFLFILFLAFIFLVIDGFIQFVTGYNLIGNTYYTIDQSRISGMFGDEAILGNYISRMLPILIGLVFLINKKSKIYNLFIVFLLIAGGSLTLITGERSSFLYFIIYSVVLLLFLKNFFYEKVAIIILAIFCSIIIYSTESTIKQRVFLNTIVEISEGRSKFPTSLVPVHYAPIYESALKITEDNLVFGIGTKMFRETCMKEEYFVENGCSTHPHNSYLQLIAEAGIIGLLPIFLIFATILIIYLKSYFNFFFRKKDYLTNSKIAFLGALFISFFPFLPTLNFFHNWYSVITFLPIGFLLHMYSDKIILRRYKD